MPVGLEADFAAIGAKIGDSLKQSGEGVADTRAAWREAARRMGMMEAQWIEFRAEQRSATEEIRRELIEIKELLKGRP